MLGRATPPAHPRALPVSRVIEDGSGPREDPALEAKTPAREEEPGGFGPGRAKPLETNRLLSRCKELAPGRASGAPEPRGARSCRSQVGLCGRGPQLRFPGRDLGGSGQEDAGRDLARHDSTEEGGKEGGTGDGKRSGTVELGGIKKPRGRGGNGEKALGVKEGDGGEGNRPQGGKGEVKGETWSDGSGGRCR